MSETHTPAQQLAAMREDYRLAELRQADTDPDPIALFGRWLDEARRAELPEPNAMTVATVDADGVPDARILLLKDVDQNGFVFYTNYSSAKGRQLAANPAAALVFVWLALERQVRVRGAVEKVGREQSERYFHSRPRGSQLGAIASRQSQVVAGRAVLEDRYREFEQRYQGQTLPLPDDWGGYRLRPAVIEFWQGRGSRLHDRLRYRRAGPPQRWQLERLEP